MSQQLLGRAWGSCSCLQFVVLVVDFLLVSFCVACIAYRPCRGVGSAPAASRSVMDLARPTYNKICRLADLALPSVTSPVPCLPALDLKHGQIASKPLVGGIFSGKSLRVQEQELRAKWAGVWVDLVQPVQKDSAVLSELSHRSKDQLTFLFMDREASTLRKYAPGWRIWLTFCQGCGIAAGSPTLSGLLDFLDALASGSASDRGKNRGSGARGVIGAMRFAAKKLDLPILTILFTPTVKSWLGQRTWSETPAKEALPLPLRACLELEQALSSCDPEDWWLISCFLLMLWGGLRWSDAQRLEFRSLVLDEDSLRGWVLRTKSSATGMPRGILIGGVGQSQWGQALGQRMLEIAHDEPSRDCLILCRGRPACYTSAISCISSLLTHSHNMH